MEHAENITADSQFLEFCGITASTELTSRIWHYTHDPERFLCVTTRLQDYATAFTPTGDVRALAVRARVDAILTTSLAFAKGKRLDSAEAVPQQHADAKHRLETLFWGNTQVISLRGLSLTACGIRQAVLDDVLWYGDLAELEASLIVVRTEELRGDAGMGDVQYLAVLAAIAMIQHNRPKTPVLDETYGILTDGMAWVFFRVDRDHKYSSLRLDWLEGQQQAIVGLIGRIMDGSVAVKMTGEQRELNQLSWTLEWSRMAGTWDISDFYYAGEWEEHEYSGSLEDDNEHHDQPSYQAFNDRKMEWFSKMENQILEILHRAKHAGKYDNVEAEINDKLKNARSEAQKGQNCKPIPSIAVTDIAPEKVFKLFKLQREDRSVGRKHWEIAPTERRTVSSHLKRNLEDIRLVYGRADGSEAVIRLTIDAVLSDILANIKRVEYDQNGDEKQPGKRASSETTTSRKSLQMSLETSITYVYDTSEGQKQVNGRMDYTLWYGQRNEAETNLMVVEAKTVGGVQAGIYQAITYMALVQDARGKAGRSQTPIYGIATDTNNWDFIRMDANGVVDVHGLSWDGKEDDMIISLIHKIVDEASCLSPVSSNTLTREKTVEELTGLLMPKRDF